MMGGDDGRQSQRLYQVSIGAALDLECNLSRVFFFNPPSTNGLNCGCVWVCVCVWRRPWALLRAFCRRPR